MNYLRRLLEGKRPVLGHLMAVKSNGEEGSLRGHFLRISERGFEVRLRRGSWLGCNGLELLGDESINASLLLRLR